MKEQREGDASKSFALGDVVFFAALVGFAAFVPFVVYAIHFHGVDGSKVNLVRLVVGLVLAAFAIMVVVFNFHVSFTRPILYRRKFESLEGYPNCSLLPGIGSVLVLLASLSLPRNQAAGITLLLLYLLDIGGVHVAAVFMVRDLFRKGSEQ